MIFSVTERVEWLRCRRSWNYGSFNRRGLSPIFPPVALNTGTIWHKAHEQWSLNPKIGFKEWIGIQAAGLLQTMKENYKERVGVYPSQEELHPYAEDITLLMYLAEKYQIYWKTAKPNGFDHVGSEYTVIVSVPNSEHKYEGTFDRLFRDRKGMLWITDYKTFDRHPNFSDLLKTEQFLDYLWILHQAIKEGQFDAKGVGGMMYDGVWKRDTKPMDELFLRKTLQRRQEEIEGHWQCLSICLNEMGSDSYVVDHHPVYNRYYTCTNCKFEYLCATHMRGENTALVEHERFVPREKQGFARENFG